MKKANIIGLFFYLAITGSCIIPVIAQDKITENGYNIIYYPTGKISSEGYMRNGRPDGYWKTYFPTGILKSEGNRRNFLLDSVWTFYNEKGDTMQKINYLVGKRNGYALTFCTDAEDPINIGRILARELFVNDRKVGLSYYFYPDGGIKEIVEFRDNKKNGTAKEYDINGNLITILKYSNGILTDRQRINRFAMNDLKEGIWQEYYDNGRIKKEMYYEAGNLNGQYKEYNEKGDIMMVLNYRDGVIYEEKDTAAIDIELRNEYDSNGNIVFSGTYKDSIPIGIHRFFDAEGNVRNAFIFNKNGVKSGEGILTKEGKKEGAWTYFYEDGRIKAKGKYSNNLEVGLWKFYFVNGKEEQKGEFKNGRYEGLWSWYFENGNIKREEEYLNGKEEGLMTEYDSVGNIITKGSYFDGEKEGEWYYKVNDFTEKGKYLGGLKDGKWYAYYPDEKLRYEGNFIQGNPDGLHKLYYNNGKIKEEQYYISGIKEKNWKKYDENGELLLTITYKDNKETRINGEKIDFNQDAIKLIQ